MILIGELVRRTLANGVTVDYSYYPDTGELHTMTQRKAGGDLIAGFTYAYYPNGLLAQVSETTDWEIKTIDYEYDDLLRLSRASTEVVNALSPTYRFIHP